jgi:hypothetical protein
MNPTTLKQSIQDAEEFLKAAKQVKIRTYQDFFGKKHTTIDPSRESATAKRKSMDLTNALIALRKSN